MSLLQSCSQQTAVIHIRQAAATVSEKKWPPWAIRAKAKNNPRPRANASPPRNNLRFRNRLPITATAKKQNPIVQCPEGNDLKLPLAVRFGS